MTKPAPGFSLGKFIFPNPTHSNQDKDDSLFFLPWVTCKDAIGDFDYPLKEDKDKIFLNFSVYCFDSLNYY